MKEDTGLVVCVLVAGMVLLLVASILLSGCSTVNGACRDIKTLSEVGISISQKGADKQMGDSIAWAIRDQNRIMDNGQQVSKGLK